MTDFDALASEFIGSQRSTKANAQDQPKDSPDDAARAIELSKSSGVPSELIYPDIGGFETQHKAALVNQLLSDDPHLRDFSNSHPLAPKIASDDWGNLGNASRSIQSFGTNLASGVKDDILSAIKSFGRGFGRGGIGSYFPTPEDPQERFEQAQQHPYAGAVAATAALIGGLPEIVLRGMSGAIAMGTHAIARDVAHVTYQDAGHYEEAADKFLSVVGDPALWESLGLPDVLINLHKGMETNAKLRETLQPYIDSGKPIPAGLSPETDAIKKGITDFNAKSLDEAIRDSAKSEAGKRSPEIFQHLPEAILGDLQLSVPAEAIRKHEDSFGWIPDLEQKLQAAELIGGDIEIPAAEFITRVATDEKAKEAYDGIKDDIKHYGLSKNGAKELETEELDEPKEGDIRFYHGGAEYKGGPRWVTQDATYAKNYREGGILHYVDIPEAKLKEMGINKIFEDEGTDQKSPYVTFEAPEEIAKGLKPISTGPPESIKSPAIRLKSGEIIEGATHADAMENAKKLFGKASIIDEIEATDEGLGGFTTSKGRLVGREEAQEIARQAEQLARDVQQGAGPRLMAEDLREDYREKARGVIDHLSSLMKLESIAEKAFTEEGKIEEPEKIVASTYTVGDRTFTGPHHVGAMDEAVKQLGLTGTADLFDLQGSIEGHRAADGFMTSKGRVVDRVEAAKIAEAAEQGKASRPGSLKMEDLKEVPKPPPKEGAEKPIFQPSALGMSKVTMERIMADIKKKAAEDDKFINELRERIVKREMSDEWRANERKVRGEVSQEVRDSPAYKLNDYLQFGVLKDVKGKIPKIDPKYLTDEQKAGIPPGFLKKGGMDPTDLVNLFQYKDLDKMIQDITDFNLAKGEQRHQPFIQGLIKDETARRMQERYGDLEKNIIDDVLDHLHSFTMMDILHQDSLYLAEKLGKEPTLTKENVKHMALEQFYSERAFGENPDKYNSILRKAGQMTEREMAAGNFAEALKASQARELAFWKSRLAVKHQKDLKRFEKIAKSAAVDKREKIDQEYHNWMQDILDRTGRSVKRGRENLNEDISKRELNTLAKFHESKNLIGLPKGMEEYDNVYEQSLPIPDFLLDPKFTKPIEKMNVEEFTGVLNALKALEKQGRAAGKMILAQQEYEFNLAKKTAIDTIRENWPKQHLAKPDPSLVERMIDVPSLINAGLVQMEFLWDRVDLGNRRGWFTRNVTMPAANASNEYSAMMRTYQRRYQGITQKYKTDDLRSPIDNKLFKDPGSIINEDWETGKPRYMTRENLRGVMLNVGSESNLKKLAWGYRIADTEKIMDFVHQYAKEEDWKFTQEVWNMFKDIQKETDKMTMGLSDTIIPKLPIRPIETKFGTFDGGYFPLRRDPLYGERVKKADIAPIFRGSPMTQTGFEKERTGAIYPLNLSLVDIEGHLSRRLRDIAFRPYLIEMNKLFSDAEFKKAMTVHVGQNYTNGLKPWLEHLAGVQGHSSATIARMDRFGEVVRQNMITMLIGHLWSTVVKHGVSAFASSAADIGAVNLIKAYGSLFKTNEHTSESNYKFIMEGGKVGNLDWKGSREVQRRERHWIETFGDPNEATFKVTPTFKERMQYWASKPVAMSDMASTLPLWLGKYQKTMDEHRMTRPDLNIEAAHLDAVEQADAAVRRAHGSTALASRPLFMQGGVLGRYMTSLYGFFNNAYNRVYKLAWETKRNTTDLVGGNKSVVQAMKTYGDLGRRAMWYMAVPALIEEAAVPILSEKDKKRLGHIGGFVVSELHFLGSTVPILSDLIGAMFRGGDPSGGLLGTTLKTGTDISRDLAKIKEHNLTPADKGKLIRDVFRVGGAVTGRVSDAQGRAAEFIYRYEMGLDKPKDIGEVLRGLGKGTLQERR